MIKAYYLCKGETLQTEVSENLVQLTTNSIYPILSQLADDRVQPMAFPSTPAYMLLTSPRGRYNFLQSSSDMLFEKVKLDGCKDGLYFNNFVIYDSEMAGLFDRNHEPKDWVQYTYLIGNTSGYPPLHPLDILECGVNPFDPRVTTIISRG